MVVECEGRYAGGAARAAARAHLVAHECELVVVVVVVVAWIE